jgi:SNF2 family DNA or RNA helicase
MMKKRQVCGGHLIDDQKRANEIGKSKIESANDLLSELEGEKVLLWASFTHEIDALSALLDKRKETYAVIDGRTKRQIHHIVNDFISGKIQHIIAHPQAAGHGTDGLQKVCNYAIYFSISFSQEQDEQSQDRLHRSGQEKKVTYFYLIAGTPEDPTVDYDLYNVVKGKTTQQEAMLNELKRELIGNKQGA